MDSIRRQLFSLMISLGLFVPLGGCAVEPSPGTSGNLEALLLARDWNAVEVAQQEGARALTVLRRAITNDDYRVRQIAVTGAARIGTDEGASLLAAGLRDGNINVRLAAANELAAKPFPGVAEAILEQINQSTDENIRETLVLAAGHIPGARTVSVLRPLSSGEGTLAVQARMALARLGDPAARKSLLAGLSSASPRMRYDTLERLRYVNDPALAGEARKLLTDRTPALRIGVIKAPRFRRVCDQALDTVVYLQKLAVPFEVNAEQIYPDQDLALVAGR